MGLKDKLLLLEYQLMYLEVTKAHYIDRLKRYLVEIFNSFHHKNLK